jgi:hypothetical protein
MEIQEIILATSMQVSQSGPKNADCTKTIRELAVFHITPRQNILQGGFSD